MFPSLTQTLTHTYNCHIATCTHCMCALQVTGPEAAAAMQQQLDAAVAQAAAAAQQHVQQFLDQANQSRAAAEADVIELRQALAGRDDALNALQQQLDQAQEQQQQAPTALAAEMAASIDGSSLQHLRKQAAVLQQEVDSLRRELAAAHQRTHEVTQMYLTASTPAPATSAVPPCIDSSTAVSSVASGRFLPPTLGSRRAVRGGLDARVTGVQPKGLLGLYKKPQVRGLFVMYFVAVHAAVSAIVIRAV